MDICRDGAAQHECWDRHGCTDVCRAWDENDLVCDAVREHGEQITLGQLAAITKLSGEQVAAALDRLRDEVSSANPNK